MLHEVSEPNTAESILVSAEQQRSSVGQRWGWVEGGGRGGQFEPRCQLHTLAHRRINANHTGRAVMMIGSCPRC